MRTFLFLSMITTMRLLIRRMRFPSVILIIITERIATLFKLEMIITSRMGQFLIEFILNSRRMSITNLSRFHILYYVKVMMKAIKIWKERPNSIYCWRSFVSSAEDCRCHVLIILNILHMFGRRCCLLALFLGTLCNLAEACPILRTPCPPSRPHSTQPTSCPSPSPNCRNYHSCFEWIDRPLFQKMWFQA